ncbi:MAG: glycosyltransferase family 4 protein [Phycisphaeraceae bacterium]|nr:glycosyltransferase family 4 protein [Phycisphaeraceae bacterium]
MNRPSLRIGFVSTRLAGHDGVSLEAFKWADVLEQLGHDCFYFSGECDRPADRSMVVSEAHFQHTQVRRLNHDLFDRLHRDADTIRTLRKLSDHLQEKLKTFIERFGINLLIAENVLSLPMNLPLASALTLLIAETGLPTVGHHHDFAWERQRYARHMASDFLAAHFPPPLEAIRHVVINTFAGHQLARRTGVSASVIPNVMDFEKPPSNTEDRCEQLRAHLGIEPGTHFLLQPTRIVPRKRIEHAITLAAWLDEPCALVISHTSGDEGDEYKQYIRKFAESMDVRLIFADRTVVPDADGTPNGDRPRFELADFYRAADLVTYPSQVEGFGNAFLEAIYYRRPIVMSTYEIFKTDIEPKGFEVIGFEGFITEQTLEQTRRVLHDKAHAQRMTDHNHRLATEHYSFGRLKKMLGGLF